MFNIFKNRLTQEQVNTTLIHESTEFKNCVIKTLLDYSWVNSNKDKLLLLFPESFTHQENIDTDILIDEINKLGIFVKNQYDFESLIYSLKFIGIIEENKINNYLIKRNTCFVLNKKIFKRK
jgi:hypothetical protein